MVEIIPAILPVSIEDLALKIDPIRGKSEIFELDVIGEDIWIEPGMNFGVHIMTPNPDVNKWIERGAKRVVVHDPLLTKERVAKPGEVGLGVELHIPLETIFPHIEHFDFIQLMSIAEIGAQGNPFDERIFDRIEVIKEKFPQAVIAVDGGINISNYQKLIEVGTDRLIIGSKFEEVWQDLQKKNASS